MNTTQSLITNIHKSITANWLDKIANEYNTHQSKSKLETETKRLRQYRIRIQQINSTLQPNNEFVDWRRTREGQTIIGYQLFYFTELADIYENKVDMQINQYGFSKKTQNIHKNTQKQQTQRGSYKKGYLDPTYTGTELHYLSHD